MPAWLESIPSELAWPLVCVIAFALAEFLSRSIRLPRISTYALIGFILGGAQLGLLPERPSKAMVLLANVAFGLLLFECGYRINWVWFRRNPWMLVISLLEALLTFFSVLIIAQEFGLAPMSALLLASLAVPTSPATVIRVIHETRASGQVVERLLHFSALNCIYAVLLFKAMVGWHLYQRSGAWWDAGVASLWVVFGSALIGAAFGTLLPALLRALKRTPRDSDLVLILGLFVAVGCSQALGLSSIVVSLVFGMVVRSQGVILAARHRDFGVMGELLSLFLFVFVAATLNINAVLAGMGLAALIILARVGSTVLVTTGLATLSGSTYQKGALVGLAMAPMSAFVILLLEQTPEVGPKLVNEIPALAALVLSMEVLGPFLTRLSLKWAGETDEEV